MKGKKDIKRINKPAIVFKGKGNEIIDYCNIPWEVKNPEDDANMGEAKVQYGDNKIVVDFSDWKLFQVVACDADGNQKTLMLLGYELNADD